MRSKQLDLSKYNSDKINNRYLDDYDPLFESLVNKDIKLLELGIYRGGSLLLWRDYFPKGTIVGIDINVPKDFPKEERISLFEGSQTDYNFLSKVANEMAPNGFDVIIDDASHVGEYTKRSFWHLFDYHLKPGGLFIIEDWRIGYLSTWPDGKKFKIKTGFFSKLRSRIKPQLTYLINIPFMGNNKIINYIHYHIGKLSPSSLRTGLLPPFNLLLKLPYNSYCYGMPGFIKQLIDEQGAITRQSKFSRMIILKDIVCVYKADHLP